MKKDLEELFDELIEEQEKRLMKHASVIIPNVTTDDLLQPNDYPELENHPFFRYEEGFLKGLHSAKMAILAWQKNT
ncbi:MAG: hypothetical protein KDK71_02210 [Chlamydiia bacterium]|nr:hypothetical protein [Chlamydiia bacterium]